MNKLEVAAPSKGSSGALAKHQDKREREFAEGLLRVGRKQNSAADPKSIMRHEMVAAESRKRGVRFLPLQVLRPIFRRLICNAQNSGGGEMSNMNRKSYGGPVCW